MMNWNTPQSINSLKFRCAFCDSVVASGVGWVAAIHDRGIAIPAGAIRICPHCGHPTYFMRDGRQIPGPLDGEAVEGITEKTVEHIYAEARRTYGESCFTASVLCCRKLLMHVAVSKGAKAGLPFVQYVEYLDEKRFVPPGCEAWIDEIRKKGNEANHEIVIMTKEQAKDILTFCEMLLKLIFEFPTKIGKR
jgi:hypothetical protein